MPAPKTEAVEFQCAYGAFQPRFMRLVPFIYLLGASAAVIGFVRNDGWAFVGQKLAPWQATLLLEGLALGVIAMATTVVLLTRARKKSPKRVVVTKSTVIAPKNAFSNAEVVLPRAEIKLKVFDAGFVKQLQIKHGRRKTLLSSALCPTDDDFEELVSHLLPD